MMIDFLPQNDLEHAVCDCSPAQAVYAAAEGNTTSAFAAAVQLGNEAFSDEAALAVLLNSIPWEALNRMAHSALRGSMPGSERFFSLLDEALSPLPDTPSDAEKKLIKAMVYRENEELVRLITAENVEFHSFVPELLAIVPELSKTAALTLLQQGMTAKVKAIVLGMLLKETEHPKCLAAFPYHIRLKYTNLLMHIIAGEKFSASEAWYPETRFCRQIYCFDPQHLFEPGEITHTMLIESEKLEKINRTFFPGK